jgi:hypothetical protein
MTPETPQPGTPAPPAGPYEAPKVERSLTSPQLEREVHYAGTVSNTR